MTPSHPDSSRPRRRLWFGLAGVLLAVSAGLTAWALYSRADAPSASNSASATQSHSDLRYSFLGYADLEQSVTPLYPLVPGRVAKVFVHDGDHIDKADTPLFELDSQAATDLVAQAEGDLHDAEFLRDAAQIQQNDAQLQLTQANKLEPQHQAQIDGQKNVIEARKQEAAAAHASADKAHRLNSGKDKLIPDEDVHAADAQAAAADAAAAGEEAKLRLLQLDDPSIGLQRAQNAVKAAQSGFERAQNAVKIKQSQLDAAKDKLREYTVKAPVPGVVERLLVSVGESLGPNPQQPAAMFAADGPRIIRAEIEQEWANHVALDMPATVQDFSATGPSWHGRVTRLSDWYTHRRSIMLEPLQFNDVRTLEAIITLDAGQPPLRIGQRVRVTLE